MERELMAYRASVIKSMQVGTISITNGNTTNTATITAVDLANTVLMFLGNAESSGGSGDGFAHIDLTNTTTVTATRIFNGNTNVVSFAVVEYYPGILKSVQQFAGATVMAIANGVTSNTQTITSVNTAKSYLNYLGTMTNDNTSGQSQNWFVRLSLTNATTVTATRDGTATYSYVGFQVVEFK